MSILTFTADAEHNGEIVACEAINDVMEEALKEETVLDVLCKFCLFTKTSLTTCQTISDGQNRVKWPP